MECPFCGGDIDFHDSFDLENCLILSIKENIELKEALQEINECLDGFYDNNNPKRLHQELRKYAGYINVISKTCKANLKD